MFAYKSPFFNYIRAQQSKKGRNRDEEILTLEGNSFLSYKGNCRFCCHYWKSHKSQHRLSAVNKNKTNKITIYTLYNLFTLLFSDQYCLRTILGMHINTERTFYIFSVPNPSNLQHNSSTPSITKNERCQDYGKHTFSLVSLSTEIEKINQKYKGEKRLK